MTYSAFEYCVTADCHCDERQGVWRIEHVTLGDAYRSLYRYDGYHSVIVRDSDDCRITLTAERK